mmetsp:Transcript_18203/g.69010  ORF Transcript_18203/g.69010 Transcript_18203/m.69010 type:complete len:810 (-) Transcript_18203:51-2480(-)
MSAVANLSLQLDDALSSLGIAQRSLLAVLNNAGAPAPIQTAALDRLKKVKDCSSDAAFEAKMAHEMLQRALLRKPKNLQDVPRPLKVEELLNALKEDADNVRESPRTPGGSRGASVDDREVCFLPPRPESGHVHTTVSDVFESLAKRGSKKKAGADMVWPIPPPRKLPRATMSLENLNLKICDNNVFDVRRTELRHILGKKPPPVTFLSPNKASTWLGSSADSQFHALPLGNANEADWLSARTGIPGTRWVEVRPGWVRMAFSQDAEEAELFEELVQAESPFVESVRRVLELRGCNALLLYDVGQSLGACQLWLALQSLGLPMAIVDGGLRAWKARHLPVADLELRLDKHTGRKLNEQTEKVQPAGRRKRRSDMCCLHVVSRLSDMARTFVTADDLVKLRQDQEEKIRAGENARRRSFRGNPLSPARSDAGKKSSARRSLLDWNRGPPAPSPANRELSYVTYVWDLRSPLEYSGAFINEPASRAGRVPWSRNLSSDVFHGSGRPTPATAEKDDAAEKGIDATDSYLPSIGDLVEVLTSNGFRPPCRATTYPVPAGLGTGLTFQMSPVGNEEKSSFEEQESPNPFQPPGSPWDAGLPMRSDSGALAIHCFYAHRIGRAAFAVVLLHALGWPLTHLRVYDEGYVDWSLRNDLPVARWTESLPVRIGKKDVLIPHALSRLKCGPVPKGLDGRHGMHREDLIHDLRHEVAEDFDYHAAATQLRWELEQNDFVEIQAMLDSKPLGLSLQNFGGFPVVRSIVPGKPAHKAGLSEGDVVLSVGDDDNGEQITWEAAVEHMKSQPCPLRIILARLLE